ncbi:hypothetical protein D3C73_1238100 [compost metagenome]
MNFGIPERSEGAPDDLPARSEQRSQHHAHGRRHDLNTFAGERDILHIFEISFIDLRTDHDESARFQRFLRPQHFNIQPVADLIHIGLDPGNVAVRGQATIIGIDLQPVIL